MPMNLPSVRRRAAVTMAGLLAAAGALAVSAVHGAALQPQGLLFLGTARR